MPLSLSGFAESKTSLRIGRAFSAAVIAFLLFDSITKLIMIEPVIQAFHQIGYPDTLARVIGGLELIIVFLYALPRTAVLGAVLLTGLLGGAVASHLRLGDPLFSQVLFGVYVGLIAWAGLYVRNASLRRLLPMQV